MEPSPFEVVPTTALAEYVGRSQVMDLGIRPLWPSPRLAGPAFTVRCRAGDNLMLHAAIHRAGPGAVVVVETGGDVDYAVAGGNVCAVAQRRGIRGFVVDGVLRDVGEIRELRFPVFARGVIPIPGGKTWLEPMNVEIRCGGVAVHPGDVVVADEDGVVVVPAARRDEVLAAARVRIAQEAEVSLEAWEEAHRARIDALLAERGFVG